MAIYLAIPVRPTTVARVDVARGDPRAVHSAVFILLSSTSLPLGSTTYELWSTAFGTPGSTENR